MDWIDEQYQNERRADELRAAQHDAEVQALLAQALPKNNAPTKNVRRALGSKLIALGERLQDVQPSPKPSTAKI